MRILTNKFLWILSFFLLTHFSALESAAQQIFATPQEAADALFRAADTQDAAAFVTLFGSNFTQEVSSGDPQTDRLGIQKLATLMRQNYKLLPMGQYSNIVLIGADKLRFPLQIALTTTNEWAFNVEDGKKLFLKRRIEKNEARALKIVEFYASAQEKYNSVTGVYASKFFSTPGKKDGLYWETGLDGLVSPIEPLVGRARNLGYHSSDTGTPTLSGYSFSVLNAQGEYAPGKTQSFLDSEGQMTKGYALLAYPSRYGISGRMTFIVGKEGIVYERDFGENTESRVANIKLYDPDPSWHAIGGKSVVVPKQVKVISTGDVYPFYTSD